MSYFQASLSICLLEISLVSPRYDFEIVVRPHRANRVWLSTRTTRSSQPDECNGVSLHPTANYVPKDGSADVMTIRNENIQRHDSNACSLHGLRPRTTASKDLQGNPAVPTLPREVHGRLKKVLELSANGGFVKPLMRRFYQRRSGSCALPRRKSG